MSKPRPPLPFAHLNLRFNPFGELSPEDRASLAVVDWNCLPITGTTQIIGPCGCGKTTHLQALAKRHSEAITIRIAEGTRTWRLPDAATPLLLLDEAQLLPRRALRQAVSRFGALVLASHYDLSGVCGCVLRTIQLTAPSIDSLDDMVHRRIAWARRSPDSHIPSVSRSVLQSLLHRHGSDIRAVFDDLYEVFQTLEEPIHVERCPDSRS